jgi:indole-3-glycerol phosphate synthase
MTSTAQAPDLLAAIVAATERMVAMRQEMLSLADIERLAGRVSPRTGVFEAALARAAETPNVIAECKRRSPSRGVLRKNYDAAAIARSYEENGAAAVSVLTEPSFFDGRLDHLKAVRGVTALPVLRKDFIVSPYQILEARAAGADAILLIVAALDRKTLASLHAEAIAAGLDVLVEIHDLTELTMALDAGARIVGVNNRNLRTLEVSTEVSRNAIERIPEGVVAVAESGLKTREDLRRLRSAGYDAFLVGERLMAAENPGRALAELIAEPRL